MNKKEKIDWKREVNFRSDFISAHGSESAESGNRMMDGNDEEVGRGESGRRHMLPEFRCQKFEGKEKNKRHEGKERVSSPSPSSSSPRKADSE